MLILSEFSQYAFNLAEIPGTKKIQMNKKRVKITNIPLLPVIFGEREMIVV
jgi:hypothetical protein